MKRAFSRSLCMANAVHAHADGADHLSWLWLMEWAGMPVFRPA